MILLLLLFLALPVHAQESLEARVSRLERLVESKGLVDMLMRLQRLQKEVQRLQGRMEVQAHAIEELKKRQRELYLDLDRRLSRLEAREAAPSPQAPAGDEGQADYEKALGLLRSGRYDEAVQAFRSFLERYPESRYVPNAWYWLGEAYSIQQDIPRAMEAFRKVVEGYPAHPKAADALLKMGFIYADQGDRAKARSTLEEVVRRYPDSSAARLARERLKKL